MLKNKKIKTFLLVTFAVGIFLSSFSFVFANNEGTSNQLFTIYPSYTHQGNKSWLLYDVKPGDTVKDFLTVENLSDSENYLKIYFVDGQEKNGTIVENKNLDFKVSSLITPSENYVKLAPREKRKIEFSYSLPRDFSFGRHVGVFYAEPVNDALVSPVSVTSRIGVRMYMNVDEVTPITHYNFNNPFYYRLAFLFISVLIILLSIFLNKKILSVFAILFFTLNFLPLADAQNMEVEVEGAGYRILGPDNIVMPDVTASFDSQVSTIDFEDLTGTGTDLEIIDENGGVPFTVSVAATNLTGDNGSIANTYVGVKNYDGDGDSLVVIDGSSDEVSLSSDTDSFASLDVSRTLFQADTFVSPGHWRIYPSLRITIPAGVAPGTYQSILTFTVN